MGAACSTETIRAAALIVEVTTIACETSFIRTARAILGWDVGREAGVGVAFLAVHDDRGIWLASRPRFAKGKGLGTLWNLGIAHQPTPQ